MVAGADSIEDVDRLRRAVNQVWLRIRGYISTARKHSANALTAQHDAITGNPWKPPAHATT